MDYIFGPERRSRQHFAINAATIKYNYMLKAILNKLGFLLPSRASGNIYIACVNEARRTEYYTLGGSPDTVDGRFDMIVLMVSLLLERIGQIHRAKYAGGDLAQEIFDIMFADMDENLREVGVSDEGMKYRIREMAGGFMGRRRVYSQIIREHDQANPENSLKKWQTALSRNVYRTGEQITPGAKMLAQRVLAINSYLDGLGDEQILSDKMDPANFWPKTWPDSFRNVGDIGNVGK